ncbi:hypothetical protein [Nocardioides perillae]|uniref:Uncharacterized protein n=1 Tax=Nocardioides perillae TaxID=1119534 RepID=A0A7Y9UVF9_9ACTN|nr:hypothetical protein [Nocardioides perillae]NYG56985.1 hypothetical protein [Nocardioides perillae]
MDLSAVIFVALAVAWAAYLVPMALKHHDEVVRSRSVDRFSHTMRVLARREPVSGRDARLVVTPARSGATAVVATKGSSRDAVAVPTAPAVVAASPAQLRARRAAARRATARRRRVLLVLLGAVAVVATLAATQAVAWAWLGVPLGLLLTWLVLCRLMVRGEHAAWDALTGRGLLTAPATDADDEDAREPDRGSDVPERFEVARNDQGFDEVAPGAETASIAAVSPATLDPTLWDPVPVTLPTYVGKPAAVRRSVRTIDLESTGVWTSGRTEVDAAIAREADAAASAERAVAGSQGVVPASSGRAVGS